MGLFTLGRVWPADGGWLMDGMEGRCAFMLGFCCYFLGPSWRFAFRQSAVDRLHAAILYGKGSDGRLFA